MKQNKRSDILELLFPMARARILRLLFNRRNKPRYLTELAQVNDIAFSTAHEELATLLTVGVVTTYSRGSRRYYRANRHHRLFSQLLALVHDADRLPPVDISLLRRNRRTKLRNKGIQARPSYPLRPDTVYSGTLRGLH